MINVMFHSLLCKCCDTQGAELSFCCVLVYFLDSKIKLTVEIMDIVF